MRTLARMILAKRRKWIGSKLRKLNVLSAMKYKDSQTSALSVVFSLPCITVRFANFGTMILKRKYSTVRDAAFAELVLRLMFSIAINVVCAFPMQVLTIIIVWRILGMINAVSVGRIFLPPEIQLYPLVNASTTFIINAFISILSLT